MSFKQFGHIIYTIYYIITIIPFLVDRSIQKLDLNHLREKNVTIFLKSSHFSLISTATDTQDLRNLIKQGGNHEYKNIASL